MCKVNHDCVLFAVCSIYKNRRYNLWNTIIRSWGFLFNLSKQLAWNWKWVAKKLCKGRKNRSETAYRTPPPPLLARHLVVISASHRKGRPCLAGAPGSESSSVPLPQEQQLPSALCCTKHHCGVAWCGAARAALPWAGCTAVVAAWDQALTPQHRGARSNLTFLMSVPAKKRWERKRKKRGESYSHWRLPNGVILSSSSVSLFSFAITSLLSQLCSENCSLLVSVYQPWHQLPSQCPLSSWTSLALQFYI